MLGSTESDIRGATMSVLVQPESRGIGDALILMKRLQQVSRIYWPNKVMDFIAVKIEKTLKERVPVKTGRMKGSIQVEAYPDKRVVSVNVPYAMIVDQGSAPHIIKPRRKKALAFEKEGSLVVKSKVKHPGFKGRHFISETLEFAAYWSPDWLYTVIEANLDELGYLFKYHNPSKDRGLRL